MNKKEKHYAESYDEPAKAIVHRMTRESCSDDDAAKLGESLAKLRGAEAEERKAEAVNNKNRADILGKILDFAGCVAAGIIGGLFAVKVANIKVNGHINAIDHVAFYEDSDVIFTGRKLGEVGKID